MTIRHISFVSTVLLVLSGCSKLRSIPYLPIQTPETWLTIQPFTVINIGSFEFTLVQPSSTFFVYSLGIVTIGAGLYFLRIRDAHQSRTWWGIALLLWGIGALFAGTSYQAFSYEIKCAGQEVCSWTSWWEVVYLMLSVASVDAMMIAESYSCQTGKWRRILMAYAVLNIALYIIVVLLGALFLNRFLLSFELLLIIAVPNILFFFILNGRRYLKYRDSMDLALLVTWCWLGITFAGYFIYLSLDITHVLWVRGAWFSENDVLHIGLMIWMIYISVIVANRIVDVPAADATEVTSLQL